MSISTDTSTDLPIGPETDLPELVAAAAAGDRTAWNSLVERFEPLVTSIIRKYRLTESDGEDVRQTMWLRLVVHMKNLREPRALPGWIATTTRNEAWRVLSAHRRVQQVDPQVDTRLNKIDQAELDENLISLERRRAVHKGLAELRSEQRELMLPLFSDTKITYQQVSSRLGIPVGSIGPTRTRCLNRLQTNTAIRALAS